MEPWMSPMLCASVDAVPVGDYALEPKLDGWRFIVHSTGRGCVSIAGRNAADYSGKLPYIESAIASCLPPDTCVDGELVGLEWGNVQSVMSSNGPHIPTVKDTALRYVIFDVIRCNGEDTRDLSWEDRRAILDAANFSEPLATTDVYPATPRALQVAVASGFEGVVCKLRDSRYVNTRSSSWVKIKAEWTCEAIVVGWEQGTGANADRLGALHAVLLDDNGAVQIDPGGRPVQIKVGGGLTDAIRDEFAGLTVALTPERWDEAVIEVAHNGVMDSGKLRHPRLVRRRDDKMSTGARARPRVPKKPATPRTPAAGSWVRNYGAMGAEKLRACIRDLELGTGDATARVMAKGGDIGLNLARAREAAQSKGLKP